MQLRNSDYGSQQSAERDSAVLNLRYKFRSVRRVLVTFASGQRYVDRQRTFTASAAQGGEFHTIEAWTFDRLRATPFFSEHRDILQHVRGQGYWLWKPYVIWRALQASEDGDLIAYNDCLPEQGNVLECSIYPMLAWLTDGTRRVVIARKPALNRAWTKRDCFHYMECDASRYWDREQIIATYMAFVAGPETRALVAEWLRFCCDPRILTDEPNSCGLDNFPEFQDHRHDQSVLSNLLIRDDFELPEIMFGKHITTKYFQDALRVFEGSFVRSWAAGVEARPHQMCISDGKPWRQSSASPWSPERGVMSAQPGDRDFFFHTEVEEGPWWLLDLERSYRVSRIEIVNRPDVFCWRANRLQVLVGEGLDDLVLIYDAVAANWDAGSPLVLNLPDRVARFVKVTIDNTAPLHLKDVRVFGRAL